MMIRVIVLLLLVAPCLGIASNHFLASPPEGWHWNNVESPPKKEKNKPAPLAPEARLQKVQKMFANVKAQAVINPTPDNVYRYLVMQQYMVEQSSLFANVAYQVVNTHPNLNNDLHNPTSSLARKAFLNQKDVKKRDIAKAIAAHYGLFFFYRGSNTADVATASIIQHFASRYGFSLIGVPMDGKAISLIKDNQADRGQAKNLGVKALPALFLVDPKNHDVQVLRYGYPSEDELLDDLSFIAKGASHD